MFFVKITVLKGVSNFILIVFKDTLFFYVFKAMIIEDYFHNHFNFINYSVITIHILQFLMIFFSYNLLVKSQEYKLFFFKDNLLFLVFFLVQVKYSPTVKVLINLRQI
jgi:hypothetical protein